MKDEELKGVNETQPTDSDEETLDFDIFGDLEDEYGEEKEKEPEEKPDRYIEEKPWDLIAIMAMAISVSTNSMEENGINKCENIKD